MQTQNKWGVFVQQNYGLLRGMRIFFAVMVIIPLFWIAVDWHGGTVNVYGIFVILYIGAVVAFLTHLLRKYKPE